MSRSQGSQPPSTPPPGTQPQPTAQRQFRARPSQRSGGPALHYVALLSVVLVLLLTSVVLVLSASPIASINQAGDALLFFRRHIITVGLALVVLVITLGVDYRFWRQFSTPMVITCLVGLAAVLAVGDRVSGSRRWLDFGSFNVQPSEVAKLVLIIAVAAFLESRRDELSRSDRIINPLLMAMGAGCGLVLLQPDLGTTTILAVIGFGMLFVSGVPLRYLMRLAVILTPLLLVLFVAADYRRARLTGFLNPIEERLGAGYQTFQSLVGLAQGGLTGSGLGAGQAKWGWVPNAHTDFIFVVAGEELGLAGGLMVLGLLGTLGFLGFKTAQRAPDLLGTLMAAGITIWLMLQSFINLGGVLGILPITGVTLPFLSFGSSSLLVTAAAAGMLLNITKQSARPPASARDETRRR